MLELSVRTDTENTIAVATAVPKPRSANGCAKPTALTASTATTNATKYVAALITTPGARAARSFSLMRL